MLPIYLFERSFSMRSSAFKQIRHLDAPTFLPTARIASRLSFNAMLVTKSMHLQNFEKLYGGAMIRRVLITFGDVSRYSRKT